jgi:D-sedoheptulose 7-phosphate isomerase
MDDKFLFLRDYERKLIDSVSKFISLSDLPRALEMLYLAWEKGVTVHTCGNGGSAAIAQHFATDWSKGVFQVRGIPLKTNCLSVNLSLLTAISNDISYSKSLSTQIEITCVKEDLLCVISSSGKSENILRAIESARQINMKIICLTGPNPNQKLLDLSDVTLQVSNDDTQIIEDTHSIFGHLFLKYMM